MKNNIRKYYEAYDDRYKVAHKLGVSWSSNMSTPIVIDVINRYGINNNSSVLEIGCGEGRDAEVVLKLGYQIKATDISKEAIRYCKERTVYKDNYRVLNCLADKLSEKFDFIYSVAVIHMLVLDEDRKRFYEFIRDHLTENGIALICTMGDGEVEMKTDISSAFEIQEREHESEKMMVAATSCRMVSFKTFKEELTKSGFALLESSLTSSLPDFNNLMYAVVKQSN